MGVKETLHDHKVYREIQAITKLEPKNIIRYYTCWIEELEVDELKQEKRFVNKFKQKMMKHQKKQPKKKVENKMQMISNTSLSIINPK